MFSGRLLSDTEHEHCLDTEVETSDRRQLYGGTADEAQNRAGYVQSDIGSVEPRRTYSREEIAAWTMHSLVSGPTKFSQMACGVSQQ